MVTSFELSLGAYTPSMHMSLYVALTKRPVSISSFLIGWTLT